MECDCGEKREAPRSGSTQLLGLHLQRDGPRAVVQLRGDHCLPEADYCYRRPSGDRKLYFKSGLRVIYVQSVSLYDQRTLASIYIQGVTEKATHRKYER
jgi:hypothetical protein